MSVTIEELQSKLDAALESVSKLEAKNKELQSEKQKAKDAADAAEAAREAAEEDKARATGDVESTHKKAVQKLQKQIDDLTAKNSGYETRLSELLVDNGIKDALAKHNVAPQYHKAVTAMLKSQTNLKDGEALLGDAPLADGIASFIASDEGKIFVAAPANSGAGSTGSRTTSFVGALPEGDFNLTKYAEMKNCGNVELAAAYAAKHGRKF